MSSPWTAPDGEEGRADARGLTFVDVALPLVAGGVLPAAFNWCATCFGIPFLSLPIVLIGAVLGGGLAGANISRRRVGPIGFGPASGVGALFAAVHIVPCMPFVGALLVTPPAQAQDTAFVAGGLAAILVSAAVLLSGAGGGCALLGHAVARGGSLGPAWVGPGETGPAQGVQMRAAGIVLAVSAALVFGSIVVCVGVIGGLTALGNSLESTFEQVEREVERAE